MTLRVPATATFAACLLLGVALSATALLAPNAAEPVRLPLSVAFAWFAPGYLFASTIFPLARDVSPLQRLALALGGSLALIIVLTFILALTPFGRSATAELLAMNVVVLLFTVAATLRHRALPEPARPVYQATLRFPPAAWKDRFAMLALGLCFLLAAAAAIGRGSATGDQATELSLVDVGAAATAIGPDDLTVVVHSHESAPVTLRLVAAWQGQIIGRSSLFTLQPGQSVQQRLVTIPPPGADPTSIDVLLFKQGGATPYRRLTVWVRTIPYRPA